MALAFARPYLAALRARFQLTLQYRAAALAGVATQGWWGMLKIMVLAAFYRGAPHQPLSLDQAIGYTWLGQAFLVMLPWNADPDVVEMVRTGAVAYERLRPVDTYGYWYARALAWTAARVLPRAVPMVLVSAVVLPLVGLGAWSLRPPADVSAGLLFVVSILCAGLLSTAMVQLVTATVVATLSPKGANAIAPALSNILSGGIAPLLLFPAWMHGALFVQPFAGLVDIPFRIYLGQLTGPGAAAGIALQIGWTGVLALGGRAFLRRTLGRLQVQGG
jgi:ABC-2 type transport system permease protein